MNFKENFKKIRKQNNITQLELAQKLEVSKTTIANYEQGVNMPNYEILEKLTIIFNCSYDDLLK